MYIKVHSKKSLKGFGQRDCLKIRDSPKCFGKDKLWNWKPPDFRDIQYGDLSLTSLSFAALQFAVSMILVASPPTELLDGLICLVMGNVRWRMA